MSNEKIPPFIIEEVIDPQSKHIGGMNSWLEQIFPEYCPAKFDKLLSNLRHSNDKHQIQIFIGLINDQVAGLTQVFYREWLGGLLADIDLLGVLEPYRRYGLASALVQKSRNETQHVARQYKLPPMGMTTLVDQDYSPIVRQHEKLGGQIRRDYRYSSGDIVVWHPMQIIVEKVATSILGDQLHHFGQLLEKQ